jgi:outer membrane lipase/esterase
MSIRLLARTLAGIGLCAAALAASAAGPYSGLVVFGDSLSDSGNNALLLSQGPGGLPPVNIPGDGYYSKIPSAAGTYSNGWVWTQYFAQSLGVALSPSLAGGNNFAFGGAQTSLNGGEIPQLPGFPYSMQTQLGMYLGATGNLADPNALYVVAGGGNNIRVALEAIAMGAEADAMGVSLQASALSFAMDGALAGALAGSGAQIFDMYGFMTGAVSNASQLGFSNWTNACGATGSSCDLNTALFWDGIHPTTLAHQQLAAAVFAAAVPEPDMAALLAVGLAVLALAGSRARRRAAVQQG